jgi:hypothetical protein
VELFSGRVARRLNEFSLDSVRLADGTVSLDFTRQKQRVKLFVLLEVLEFVVIFSCMILMRFGL